MADRAARGRALCDQVHAPGKDVGVFLINVQDASRDGGDRDRIGGGNAAEQDGSLGGDGDVERPGLGRQGVLVVRVYHDLISSN